MRLGAVQVVIEGRGHRDGAGFASLKAAAGIVVRDVVDGDRQVVTVAIIDVTDARRTGVCVGVYLEVERVAALTVRGIGRAHAELQSLLRMSYAVVRLTTNKSTPPNQTPYDVYH